MRRLAALLAVLGALPLLAGCFSPSPSPPSGVVLWGDSFGESVRAYLPFEARAMGGTAPCDWARNIREQAATNPPAVAILLFTGNNFTPCTGNATGQALVDRYRVDMAGLVASLQSAGSRVIVLGVAPMRVDGLANPINDAYVGAEMRPAATISPYLHRKSTVDPHLTPTGEYLFAQAILAVL